MAGIGTNRTARFGVALIAACAGSSSLTAGASDAPREESVLTARGGLSVSDPDAKESRASRINTDLADKLGRVPSPTPGYTVHARVIVETQADAAEFGMSLRPAHGARIDEVRAHPSVSGFLVIDCPTIREAARLRDALHADSRCVSVRLEVTPPRALRAFPTDPGMPGQWYLRNTRRPEVDLNVVPVWAGGITGAGITVGVVEGGWQTDHPDIAPNYNDAASMPMGSATSHSTSCAGIIGAAANGIGGAGVAYGAGVSKLVYGSSSVTADALAFKPDLNHIKSNSWGPPDQGILETIAPVELAAIEQNATTGRGGLGTIYTWAAGNGGLEDRVDYDPYASSRHTIAVGAIGDQDQRADYNEPGSALMVVAPSSGNVRRVFTTANQSGYNPAFGGTSAASPMAAGVIALMLEANPSLSARDVRHILVRSARVCDPTDPAWTTNGAGHDINEHFGFGAIDAHAAVTLAQGWESVPDEATADTGVVPVGVPIPDNDPAGVSLDLVISDAVNAEHVEVILDATTNYVGDLRITLTSPTGTVSVLADNRDDPQNDLVGRVFTTVRHWDEPAAGTWRITIADRGPLDFATWDAARIVVYGVPTGPTPCSPADLADPLGSLNFFDLAAFIGLFNTGDDAADLDGNQLWNFFDVAAYIASYNAGCP